MLVIDPGDPATPRFNPLQGDPLIVAEVTRTVLKSMFGRQEAFFSHVRETSAHNTVLLLKYREAHDREVALAEGREPPCLTMQDLVRVLRNPEQLKARVDALRRLDPQSDIVEYFDREALGPTGQKLHEFAMGLRMQLEDIAGSPQLRQVFGGRSDVDLDLHLRGGGVLCVNTCMGLLGRKGDLFGRRRPAVAWWWPFCCRYCSSGRGCFPPYIAKGGMLVVDRDSLRLLAEDAASGALGPSEVEERVNRLAWGAHLSGAAYLARVLLGLLPASLYVRRVFAWYA